jgi:TonB-linked SusC/RagA family outer membrane protein
MKPFAPTTNSNISMQGGTDFVKYFCSLAYLYEGDYFKSYRKGYNSTSNNFSRFNYRANLDFSLTKTTQLSLNLGGDYGIRNTANSGYWGDMYFSSTALFPAYFPDWVLVDVPDKDYPEASGLRLANALGDWSGNPYTRMNSGGFSQTTESKLYTDLILTQKLDFLLKGLSLKGSVSLSTYFRNQSLYSNYTFPEYTLDYAKIGVDANGDGKVDANPWFRIGQGNEVYTQDPLDINVGGLEGGYYRNLYYEMSLNYNNTFGRHSVSGLLLMNRQERYNQTDFPFYYEAWVGRATYDYNHKYLLEVNIGYTGSERFAPGNRFGFFPSGAIGWVISEESFFKNAVPWMSKLKIRYSDGLVGSDIASSRWLYKSDYYYDARGYIREDKGANLTAQWEEARKRDIGIEVGLFKNVFTVSVDLFDEYRDKMLLSPRSVTFLVGNSFKDLNLGSLKKHGIEIEAELNKSITPKLSYFIKGIFGYNENRILNKDDLPYAPEYSKDAGKPLGSMLEGVELTGTGYFTSVDDIHLNPAPVTPDKLQLGDYKYLDYTADGLITTLDKHPIYGNMYPPVTYSLSSGFSYKGFDFSFMFQGNSGKYVEFYGSYDIEFRRNTWRVNTAQLNYWRPDNQVSNDHPTLHASASSSPQRNWGGGESDRYGIRIKDHNWRVSDYLRLKEIYAGYTFNTAGLKKAAGISNVLIFLSANNIFTLTPLIEGDPERKDFSNGYYPLFSTYNIGLKFGF